MPSRRHALARLAASALVAMSAPAIGQPGAKAALARQLAPSGRLRACINLGNAVLAKREASGEPGGVSVDLARAFARELAIEVEFVVVDAAIKSVEAVRGGQADIGFFAIDPARSDGLRFSAPYVLIEGAYLVRRDSPIIDNAQVDRTGTHVMVGKGSAYDLFLTRTLKQAELVRTVRSQDVVNEFLAQGVEVAAAVKQQLEADAARLGDRVRLLPGRFMVIEQAMGLPADRGDDASRALREFVERAKASGFVGDALKRHGVQGAIVAPPAATT